MDIIAEIRRRHLVSGETISVIARSLNLSRPAVRKHLRSTFAPGEACQFDWSHEQAETVGVMQTIKVAQFRLCHSRKMFVAACPRETQEMVFDAHNRAFAFFGGVPQRVICDNLKTAVDAILTGKDRVFNRRFLTLTNHYLFEPVACTPAAGWEKGQAENQAGNVREWLFTPLARFASFTDLNHWLARRCRELAQRKHPSEHSRSIAECFVQEQANLRVIDAPFDGYIEQMRSVSKTCLIRVDRNQYSVPAQWAGKVVSVRCSADEVRIVADDQLIALHVRRFGRGQLVYDPSWHYLAVLEKKPGALRNGAPFVTWDLPEPIRQVRERLLKQARGDRAFADLLLVTRDVGLEALQVACELALESGVINGSHVMNELRRLTSPARPVELTLPEALQLRIEPLADCQRYEQLRGTQHAY